ncbi:MAG: fabD [Frankiales bacterium]|nr:fabD [Frankiales bacterium]
MRVALVLPGQGSQRPGAGTAWTSTAGWRLVERASEVLGRDVAGLLLDADAEQLRATREAQLSTFLLSLVVADALPQLDVVAVAGHSLGDLTALVVGGALSVEDGLRLVDARGAAMQEACDARPGTMAAVLGLAPEAVAAVLPDDVWPANDNAPLHVVVSGGLDAVAAAGPLLKQAGARRVLPLPVGGAFHTPHMAPARPRLEAALATVSFRSTSTAVLSGSRAGPYDDPAATLSAQLTAPIRWRETLLALLGVGVDAVVECGPGSVLTGLAKRTLPGVRALSVSDPSDLSLLEDLL